MDTHRTRRFAGTHFRVASILLEAAGLAVGLAMPCLSETTMKEVVRIDSRLELFVDDRLIESLSGAEQRLHHPVPREKAWEPPEGSRDTSIAFVTVFRDGHIHRMYYRGYAKVVGVETPDHEVPDQVTRYAESTDGIRWRHPDLGIFQTADGKPNNIVWAGVGCHNFTPFKDTHPECRPEARYKAVGRIMYKRGEDPSPPQPDDTGYRWLPGIGLLAFQSPDGIHWSRMQEERIVRSRTTRSPMRRR